MKKRNWKKTFLLHRLNVFIYDEKLIANFQGVGLCTEKKYMLFMGTSQKKQ